VAVGTTRIRDAGRILARRCVVTAIPRSVQRRREGITEYIESSHYRVMESGVDLPPASSSIPRLFDEIRTTVDWAIRHRAPVEHGTIRRLRYVGAQRLAFVIPRRPTLLPVEGVWLPVADLEHDDA
jgi:hypothetical protein